MAVTFISEPEKYTPTDNPIVWQFDSDQTAQANFSFLVRVEVDFVVLSEHTIFPEVGNNAHFDASETMKSLVPPATVGQSVFNQSGGNFKQVRLIVIERYGSPPSQQASAASNPTQAFKASLSDKAFIDWDHTVHSVDTGKKYLTDFPTAEKYFVGINEDQYLLSLTQGLQIDVEVELFDASGVSIVSDTITINSPSLLELLSVGPQQIILNFTITQANFDAAEYYEVRTDRLGNIISQRFYIEIPCLEFQTRRFHFLTKIGGIDSYTFTALSRERANIGRKEYERQFGGWNDTTYEFNTARGRQAHYVTRTNLTLEVNSDWITEGVQNFLVSELYESPQVHMDDGSEVQLVLIQNTQSESKKSINGELISETMNIKLSKFRKSVVI